MLCKSYTSGLKEAGCDEAGRGCLAGPVFAAAVILPKNYSNDLLNDSKKINRKNRDILRLEIEKKALSWAVASCSAEEVDEINILNASIEAMHRALGELNKRPELILVDGNRFKAFDNIDYKCIIKGDGKFNSIAAASILAKTYRDEYMENLHQKYPVYNWAQNKGYPTKEHKNAISLYGISPFHRKSFKLSEQLRMDFQ